MPGSASELANANMPPQPACLIPIPEVIREILSVKVSLERLSQFLSSTEVKFMQRDSRPYIGPILCKNATVGWIGGNSDSFTLHNLDVRLPPTGLILVFGPTGSGKTLFVLAQGLKQERRI